MQLFQHAKATLYYRLIGLECLERLCDRIQVTNCLFNPSVIEGGFSLQICPRRNTVDQGKHALPHRAPSTDNCSPGSALLACRWPVLELFLQYQARAVLFCRKRFCIISRRTSAFQALCGRPTEQRQPGRCSIRDYSFRDYSFDAVESDGKAACCRAPRPGNHFALV